MLCKNIAILLTFQFRKIIEFIRINPLHLIYHSYNMLNEQKTRASTP